MKKHLPTISFILAIILLLFSFFFSHPAIVDAFIQNIPVFLLGFLFKTLAGLIIIATLCNAIHALTTTRCFNNPCFSFLGLNCNDRFYLDLSLENVLIGKNGPRLTTTGTWESYTEDQAAYDRMSNRAWMVVTSVLAISYVRLKSPLAFFLLQGSLIYGLVQALDRLSQSQAQAFNRYLSLALFQNVVNLTILDKIQKESQDPYSFWTGEIILKIHLLKLNNDLESPLAPPGLLETNKLSFFLLYYALLSILYLSKEKSKLESSPLEWRVILTPHPYIHKQQDEVMEKLENQDREGLIKMLPKRLRPSIRFL